jgi:D-alanyl-lipoteichoic acid acyltransferase DltB (MBOAT superfamily)
MIFFPTSYALAAIILSAAAVLCLPLLRRQYGHLVLSLLVASVFYRDQFLGYLLWVMVLFAFARVVERLSPSTAKAGKKRWKYACAAMLTVIAIFFAGSNLDQATIRAFGVSWTVPDRDMWLLLRTISFLWEFGSGRLKQLVFVDFVIWITFPFTLLGPLIRPTEFSAQYVRSASLQPFSIIADRNWWQKLLLAVAQMVIAGGLARATKDIDQSNLHWLRLFEIFGTGPWGFFLMTSGTFHLMECMALLWGIELLPSFNYPFGQMNLSDFWARWNMTVTRLCTDYLFYNRWGLKKTNAYFNLMTLFFAVGLWHDMNLYWGTWGILHGIGFCIYLWYRTHKQQLAWFTGIGSGRVREMGSRVLTYVFVCLCWYIANKIVFGLFFYRQLPHHLY